MIRTSIFLPATLHQRLLMASKRRNRSLSELMREILNKALVADEDAQIKHMYRTLSKLEGLGEKGITDASTTINETLYGEHGAWRPREY